MTNFFIGIDFSKGTFDATIMESRRELSDKEAEHQKEVSFLKSIIQKAKKWFPLFQELVYMEKFCLKVGFNERQTATLISGKPLFYEGELYSEEHNGNSKPRKRASKW